MCRRDSGLGSASPPVLYPPPASQRRGGEPLFPASQDPEKRLGSWADVSRAGLGGAGTPFSPLPPTLPAQVGPWPLLTHESPDGHP